MAALAPTIRRATPAETDTVAAVLTEAFLHGDLGPWLVPTLDTREKVYWPYFRLLAEGAQAAGWIDITDDLAAVALWYSVVRLQRHLRLDLRLGVRQQLTR